MDILRIQTEFSSARSYFPYVELHPTLDGKLYVKAALQPSTQGFYVVAIYFPDSYPNAMPRVDVVKPVITSAPHRYKEGNICYMHPTMWNPGAHNLTFVIQRATKWLGKYEIWKQKGVWPGAQIKH